MSRNLIVPSHGKYTNCISEASQGGTENASHSVCPFPSNTLSHVMVAWDAGECPLGGFWQELEPRGKSQLGKESLMSQRASVFYGSVTK